MTAVRGEEAVQPPRSRALPDFDANAQLIVEAWPRM